MEDADLLKFCCPSLQILLPVALNFVARRYKFCCPSFSKTMGVEIYTVARRFFKRRPWF